MLTEIYFTWDNYPNNCGFLFLNRQDELKGDYENILVALCGSDN